MKYEDCRRDAKRDDVRKGVELDSDGRLRFGQTCDPAVDPVEEEREDDEERGAIEIIGSWLVRQDQDGVVTAKHT